MVPIAVEIGIAVAIVLAVSAPAMIAVPTVVTMGVALALDAATRAALIEGGAKLFLAVVVIDALDAHIEKRITMREKRVAIVA